MTAILWIVRHGESTANEARQKSEREKLPTIEFPEREPDVRLSVKGGQQSRALGNWLATQNKKPQRIFTSPYLRARATVELMLEAASLPEIQIISDERLRERELGIFDRLTKIGAMQKYPDECEKRERLGKFYYRPPGGENWADVALRVRSFLRDFREDIVRENSLIVTHEVVVRIWRYLLEDLSENEILSIDRECDVGNCAVTSYEFKDNSVSLSRSNYCPF